MNLTPNFKLEEFTASEAARRHGLSNEPNEAELARLRNNARTLEIVRFICNDASVRISSGFRSDPVNRKVGGVPTSDHRKGDASDFTVPGYGTPLVVARRIEAAWKLGIITFDQLIYEHTWIHLSTAPRMRGQVLTLNKGGKGYLSGIVAS